MNTFELLDRPIAFQRSFVRLTGSINAALMLSQAVYWSRRTSREDGSFYKTQEEWEDETGLTRRQQDTARETLRDLGLLIERKGGVPCRVFYRVDEAKLGELCTKAPNSVCTKEPSWFAEKAPSKFGGKRQTNTETTQRPPETTSKSKVFELPAWIDPEMWAGYLEVRKAKRAPPTERALSAVVRQLAKFRDKGLHPNEILETSVRSNWTDVYEPKANGGGFSAPTTATQRSMDGAKQYLETLRNHEEPDGPIRSPPSRRIG